MLDESTIRTRYEQAGQGHVLQHIHELSEPDKTELLSQLEGIRVEELASLLQTADSHGPLADVLPFSGPVAWSSNQSSSAFETYRNTGMQAIRHGQVAALVLAGGQGTRLGFDGPKGMYNIGLPSGKTLFQLMAERILKLSQLAQEESSSKDSREIAIIPFFIMTSPLNHNETIDFFAANSFFGLGQGNVYFFEQGMLPCVTEDGKIIMEAANRVAMAPDGNGGIYPSLLASGGLENMARRGIRYLHVFSVDNALVKPADPIFIGYCIMQNADCGNKVVWKAHAHEKVGVVASRSGKPCIVEYSEISTAMAEMTDQEGRLVFGAANICNHFYTMDFLRDTVLPNMGSLYHIARKKIAYYDSERKETVTPVENNGIKLESFIFDVFPLSQRMAVFEVDRAEEFAPVKNQAGSPSDSPEIACEMISTLAKKWVLDAGGRLGGPVELINEISPLTSYAGEGLDQLVKDKEINCPFIL